MTCDPDSPALRVVHIGPPTGTPGGIASVIAGYVSTPTDGDVEHLAIASTSGRRRAADVLWFLVGLSRAVMLLRRPGTLLHAHVSQRGSLLREGTFLYLARAMRRPAVVTVHGSRFEEFARRHRTLSQLGLWPASAILCLTGQAIELVRELVPQAPVRRTVNAVPVDREWVPLPDTPTVAFVGEVGRRKGVDRLVQAWPEVVRAVPNARLVIAGPVTPDGRSDLGCLLELDGVEYVGVLPVPAVRAMLHTCWLLALPSRAEASPRSVIEAMAGGRAVVAADVGGMRDLVTGDVGHLLDPMATGLASAVIDLLSAPHDAADMGRAALRRATVSYDLAAHLSDLSALYRRLSR
jgi:glycosyltransferase involved in cell wall biosynthesis